MNKLKFLLVTAASLLAMSNTMAAGLAQEVDGLLVTTESLNNTVDTNTSSISNINKDILYLYNKLNSIPVPDVYDYKNFAGKVSSKTYKLQGFSGCGDTEIRTISRTVNGTTTNLHVNRVRTLAGSICQNKGFNYEETENTQKLINKENLSFGGSIKSVDILGKPIALLTSAMTQGSSFGNATGIKRLDVATGIKTLISVFANTTTAVAIEDVTVPAGTFTGCLKVHTVRNSGAIGRFDRYSWYCPGLGEVKRTQIDPVTLEYRFWKMTSYTP